MHSKKSLSDWGTLGAIQRWIVSEPFQKRFWKNVKKGSPNECWPWIRSHTKNGYGKMGVQGKMKMPHRVSFEISNGKIPEGLCVLHKCDNRSCCNPSHLWIGTKKENTLDCQTKGRFGACKLTEADIEKIRSAKRFYGAAVQLAKRYNVSNSCIYRIRDCKTWTHLIK